MTRRIAQVNTVDFGGGASRVARNLFKGVQAAGHQSQFFVLRAHKPEPGIVEFASLAPPQQPRQDSISRLRRRVSDLQRRIEHRLGFENFNYGNTDFFVRTIENKLDLLHLHNLHSGYFDLRILPSLSRSVKTALTLHDAWAFTGHCAHYFDCERWQNACGSCPHLDTPPRLEHDGTRFNLIRKRWIYARSRLWVCSPSEWLKRAAQKSVLMGAASDIKVIPNGIDLGVFHSADKLHARQKLGLPQDAKILTFAASNLKNNPFKDYPTLTQTLDVIAGQCNEQIIFIGLGDQEQSERRGAMEVRYIPFQPPETVANFFQASDIYLHPARAETFGLAICEAMACGMPVIASKVGGIPELIVDYVQDRNNSTGVLIEPGNVSAFVKAILLLLRDDRLREQMAGNAEAHAKRRFGLEKQIEAHLSWYEEILAQ